MGQVSRKFDLNPPNVRSKCILANIYKARKRLDQGDGRLGGGGGGRETKKEIKTIHLLLHPRTKPEDEHLANFYAISS